MRRNDLYTEPLVEPAQIQELDRTQRTASWVGLAGAALILLWALTAEVSGSRVIGTGDADFIDPWTALLRAVEVVARLLVTTAVFSHLFLHVSARAWRAEKRFREHPAYQYYDNQMAWVEYTFERRPGA